MGLLGAGLAAAAGYGAEGMFAQMKAEIEQEKQQRLLEFKEQMKIRGEEREIANAPRVAEAKGKAEGLLAAAKVDSDEQLGDRRRAIASADATSKANTDLEWRKANASDVNKLKRDEARATHIESASSVAQAALANWQLDRAKLIGASQDALAIAEKSGDKKSIDSARKQLSALNSKGDNPRDAQTMVAAQNAYLAAAKNEDDPEKKAELMASAKTWGDLAAKEMNAGGGNGDLAKLRELRDGGKGGGGKPPESVKQLPAEQSSAVTSPTSAAKPSGPSRVQMEMQLSGLEKARSAKLSPSESSALEAQIKSIKDKLQSMQ